MSCPFLQSLFFLLAYGILGVIYVTFMFLCIWLSLCWCCCYGQYLYCFCITPHYCIGQFDLTNWLDSVWQFWSFHLKRVSTGLLPLCASQEVGQCLSRAAKANNFPVVWAQVWAGGERKRRRGGLCSALPVCMQKTRVDWSNNTNGHKFNNPCVLSRSLSHSTMCHSAHPEQLILWMKVAAESLHILFLETCFSSKGAYPD